MKALVLITVATGADEAVRDAVSNIRGVRSAFMVYGVYDVVATVEVDSMGEMRRLTDDVREVDNVRSTLTLMQVE
ncbi:MAG: Lrp/AsnC ligand binding domain-containing protein [Candidatus Geothermarchaeales archaeon]